MAIKLLKIEGEKKIVAMKLSKVGGEREREREREAIRLLQCKKKYFTKIYAKQLHRFFF